jgi:hypothetical protein
MATQPFSRKTIFASVIGTGIVLIIISVYYRSSWVEPVATVLLCCITGVYALFTNDALRVTREQLELLKRQNERQDRVLLFVDLSCEPPLLRLHVFNLGLSGVLVQSIVARSSDDMDKPQTYDLHKIVASGKTERVDLPRDLWDGEGSTDFEFTVHYVGINGPGSTPAKTFNAFSFGPDDNFVEIKDGLDAPWYLSCPKCRMPALTDVTGLKTFEVAQARRKQVEEDLALSCGDHKSDWMLTVEKIKEAQKARKNRRKL